MEILINKVIIQVLDTTTNVMVPSTEIKEYSDVEYAILNNMIKKVMSMEKRHASLLGEVGNNSLLVDYDGNIQELADNLGKIYFDLKTDKGVYENTDLIIVEFRVDEIDYLLVLDKKLKNCYSHNVSYEGEEIVNRLIEYKSVISKDIGKEDRFILYDYKNGQIYTKEEPVNGEYRIIEEGLFEINSAPTTTEIVKVMEKSVKEISEKYEMPVDEIIPEFKSHLIECEKIVPEEVAEMVFHAAPIAKQEFQTQIRNMGIKEDYIPQEKVKLPKKDRTLKLVTETGIEIIIPANYMKRKDKVEIINNPDGTTSIQIKNISKLKNK